jgi:tRNA wybutosine-synthesizing protein 3
MPRDNFLQRKTAVLSKSDKSSIGGWDKPIISLCEKINLEENLYTTSSCSGRIIIMVDQDKKGKGLFKFVSHDLVDLEELRNALSKICGNESDTLRAYPEKSLKKIFTGGKFKSESPIIHICCRDLESAEEILNKSRDSGWKRSGIISLGKNIIVEMISTEKLEFPIIKEGKILVDDDFLKIVLEKANDNLKKGWLKIKKLEKEI